MAVTIMRYINKLSSKIISHFNTYRFEQGADFRWSPSRQTIFYPKLQIIEDICSLLHETAHAELRHNDYISDLELVGQEARAWEYAKVTLAPKFDIAIDDDYIADHLDTYRLWLYERSKCPDCGQNGLQTQNTYQCLNCRCLWRANEARLCSLRRIRLQDQKFRV